MKKEHSIKKYFPFVLIFLLALAWLFYNKETHAVGFDNGYGFRKRITLQGPRLPAGLSQFPILISYTDPALKHTGEPSPGRVTDLQGDDIVFTDSDGTTQLAHQVEVYDRTNGRIAMWVRVPAIVASTNKDIFIYYGNSSVTTFQGNVTSGSPAITGVWDANYVGVWHLNETTGAHMDSSASPVNSNLITVGAQGTATGIAGGADNFTANTQIVRFPNSSKWGSTPGAVFTLEAWVNGPNQPAGTWQAVLTRNDDTNLDWDYALITANGGSNNNPSCYGEGDPGVAGSSVDLTANAWTYLICTTQTNFYVNGTNTGTGIDIVVDTGSVSPLYIGSDPAFPPQSHIGIVDEVRISNNYRTAGWIATTYNTIRCPGPGALAPCTGDFYTVGAEETGNSAPTTPTLAETPPFTFANLNTNDTTPNIGPFASTDTELNPIEYEIQWDTDVAFAPTPDPITKNSASFALADNGFTQATFTSGANVTYTPTGVGNDIFVNGTTYWWHVRARDPAGSNTWSSYSAPRSFTITTALTLDEWLQTTSDQFTTPLSVPANTLSNTEALPPGGVRLRGW